MATDLIGFMKELESTPPGHFESPQFYYGAQEDSFTIYFRDAESYARRLNSVVTIFLSFDGDQLVGCQVKGLMKKLDEGDGRFKVAVRHDKIMIGLFFHLLAYEEPEAESRNRLVELGQTAKGLEVDRQTMIAPCP